MGPNLDFRAPLPTRENRDPTPYTIDIVLTWRRALVYTHRWLGVAGCLLFTAWFASGIVMIYARMPALDAAARAARQQPIDLALARVAPDEAARTAGLSPQRVRIGMLAGRPAYRFFAAGRWTTVFADDGARLERMTPEQAIAEAQRLAPAGATAAYDGYLSDADQWTLETRSLLPMHRIAFGDPADTRIYVSDRSGEPVVETTRSGRRWGYAGAVVHWLYFTPLRKHAALWTQTIIWLSVAGCVMCMSGLAWGLITLPSPYSGIMRWHHYAGLIFGLFTCTWIFSGLLSMDPWAWHPGTGPTPSQRSIVAGGALQLDGVSIDAIARAMRALPALPADAELLQFRGARYLRASAGLVSIAAPERGVFERFPDAEILAAARAAMPSAPIDDATWLGAYDSYYYDRDDGLPLPVLRVRFADQPRTWLYLDPRLGAIVRKEERLTRVNRWLYHGLHSLDFPFLYARRPLWDIVMIGLSVGGLMSALTSLAPAARRLRRTTRRRVS
jgi:hypothetical protein